LELVDAGSAHSLILPWEPLRIMPVGDIQYDGKNGAADIDRLHRHLQWGIRHEVKFIGMGDIVDILSPSNRQRFAAAGLFDSAHQFFDDAVTRLEEEILEVLLPTRGMWIGLLQGHHYYTHLDGTTSDTRFAKWLDCPFLGDCAIVRLHFQEQTEGKGKRHQSIKMWVHHGAGGAGVMSTTIYNAT